ncbi:Ig-like domain-containing protein, partial [Scandinavium sp. M-37]|uniref:Ig-like domain-containing protein n=1 Tax=Scandinavium sp. M-37 TaxID=3373077 RepID=UPI00374706AB
MAGEDFVLELTGSNQDSNDTTPPDAPEITFYFHNEDGTDHGGKNGSSTLDNTPTLYGNAEPGSLVTIYDNGIQIGTVNVDAGGRGWHFMTPELSEGSHHFTVTATDASGNISDDSQDFVVNVEAADTTAPDAPSFLPASDDSGEGAVSVENGGTTADTAPDLRGVAEANSLVTVYENGVAVGSVKASANGTWVIYDQPLSEGTHNLTATATDAAGNISGSSEHFVITIDTDITA